MKESSKSKEYEKTAPQQTAGSPTPMRTYRDRIFRMVFQEKRELLELYNAMNGTDYTRQEDLEITTLENAIYLNMKNDLSFLLYDRLTLYEHQSTDNPNMPLRDLLYVADLYSNLVRDRNIYSTQRISLPEPRFVEFYNGIKKIPERSERKLSDAYAHSTEEPALELKTLVLNINPGNNQELMDKCRTLKEYMIFVEKVRKYRKLLSLEQAVERAVTECMDEDVLADFLRKNRAEVIKVGIYEYNEELHIQMERDEAMEAGFQRGIEEGKAEGKAEGIWLQRLCLIRKQLSKGQSLEEIADLLDMDLQKVQEICSLISENPNAGDGELYELYQL